MNTQQPEFTVQNGAIRLIKTKTLSGESNLFALEQNDSELQGLRKDALVEDFSQTDYQAAEGLTADMLTYLPGEDVLDFDTCSPEQLAMVIQKWCMQRERPPVQSVDPLYEEFLRDERLAEFQKTCQDAIYEGVEVETSEGIKKFSLTMQDQINLIGVRNLLDMGSSAIPYHADGEPIRLWSHDDVQKILQEADRHTAYHRVYFSLLREWLRRMSYPEFLGIDYGDALPDDLAQSMMEVLKSTTGGVILQKRVIS
jgi:hypothetical protein